MAGKMRTELKVHGLHDHSISTSTTHRRSKQLLLTTAIALAGGFLTAGSSEAACNPLLGALVCDGDLSGGVVEAGDFGPVTVENLTADVGTIGLRFESTTNRDIEFDVNLNPFQISLDTTYSRSRRSGFEGRTDGAVSGNVVADITGATVRDATNVADFDLNNFGTFSIISGTGIDLSHSGEIDVQRPTITATVSRQPNAFAPGGERDFVMGQFGAIRLRDASGDIDFTNNGNVSLDGGQRNLNVDRSGDPGTNQRVFSTRFSTSSSQSSDSLHHGLQIEANGNIDVTQNGNVSLTGGGINASSTVSDAVASTLVKHSDGRGVFVRNNPFGSDDQVSFSQQTNLTVNGNISLTSGEVVAQSTATTATSGGGQNKAILRTDLSTQIGVWLTKPSARIVTINGDIRVVNGKTTLNARAVDGSGNADGLAAIQAFGIGGSGFESSLFNFGSTDPDPTRLNLTINGDVLVTGGDVEANVVATGTSTINDLDSRSIFTPDETLRINRFGGSSATGVSLFADELTYDIGGMVTVTGGNVTSSLTGSNLDALVFGGGASALSIGAGFGAMAWTSTKPRIATSTQPAVMHP